MSTFPQPTPEPTGDELDLVEARSRAHALRIVRHVYADQGLNEVNELLGRDTGEKQCPVCGHCFTPDSTDFDVVWHGKDPVYGDDPPDLAITCPCCRRQIDADQLLETD